MENLLQYVCVCGYGQYVQCAFKCTAPKLKIASYIPDGGGGGKSNNSNCGSVSMK